MWISHASRAPRPMGLVMAAAGSLALSLTALSPVSRCCAADKNEPVATNEHAADGRERPEFFPAIPKSDQKILAVLEQPTKMDFVDMPLQDAITYLADYHGIAMQLDTPSLEDVGRGSDTPVTLNVDGVSLRSGLALLLADYDLTAVVQHDVLLVTTQTTADSILLTRAYPVSDFAETKDTSYDALVDAITSCVKPHTWRESGGPGEIRVVPGAGAVVILQTREVHDQVLTLLRALRAAQEFRHGE
ncbi:MAG: hypothetical protein DWQ37_16235 [Planctomycetota bacterium]|nr:MAG: hypothetical protein DWQ37_16235 [Planctomycetota bacterium]